MIGGIHQTIDEHLAGGAEFDIRVGLLRTHRAEDIDRAVGQQRHLGGGSCERPRFRGRIALHVAQAADDDLAVCA